MLFDLCCGSFDVNGQLLIYILPSLHGQKSFEEVDDAFNVIERRNHRDILVWSNDDNGTMLRINTTGLVSASVAMIIAFVIHEYFVRDYMMSAGM